MLPMNKIWGTLLQHRNENRENEKFLCIKNIFARKYLNYNINIEYSTDNIDFDLLKSGSY